MISITFPIELVQASERRSFAGRHKAIDGQHLIEPLKDAGGDTGGLLVQPTGETAQHPLVVVVIVEFTRLPECPAHQDMKTAWSSGSITFGVVSTWQHSIGTCFPRRFDACLLRLVPSTLVSRRDSSRRTRVRHILDQGGTRRRSRLLRSTRPSGCFAFTKAIDACPPSQQRSIHSVDSDFAVEN